MYGWYSTTFDGQGGTWQALGSAWLPGCLTSRLLPTSIRPFVHYMYSFPSTRGTTGCRE